MPAAPLLPGGGAADAQGRTARAQAAGRSTATTGCKCDVSASYAGQGSGTYTTSNDQVVTSANNHYDYCVGSGSIDMQWVSGPNAEPGVYTLTKQ